MADGIFVLLRITESASDEENENAEDMVDDPALSEDDVACEEFTVVDNDNCAITVTGVDISSSSCSVSVQFKNKTDDVTLVYSVISDMMNE